jgi:hypothetical protein
MLIDVGGHQALRTTGGGKLDLRTLSFHGYTGPDTVEPGADDIEHGRYNDHDEEDRLPSPPIANAAAAAPIFCRMAIRTQTCRCKAPDSWQSSCEAGQPSRWSSTPTCPGGLHSFDLFQSIRFENVPDGIDAFVAWVISRPGQ